jgi:hypothetical protein
MSRPTRQDADAPGHDSFLDIVANMVGILIILVMVVGMRAKNAPVVAALSPEDAKALRELEKDRATEESLREEVLRAADEVRSVQRETLIQARQRDVLATLVAAAEHTTRSSRQEMDAGQQEQFDLGRSLAASKLRLEQLQRELAGAETTRAAPILVESYPTPLSRTVSNREAHFQLRDGLIAFIPLDELVDQLKESAQQKKYKLRDLPEMTATIGPLGGFRMRYTLQRKEVPAEVAMVTGRGGSYAELKLWTLIPISGQLGEPVETALAEGSEFRRALSQFHPDHSAITIWTYPDSFDAFRRIKKELYRLGFAAAARPLPEGTPISGSPQGSKSAAQ